MALGKMKEKLIAKKEERMMPLTIEPFEIIILVNYAWELSFGRCIKNKKAICERGWGPLNRTLLLHETIRATMTAQQEKEEPSIGVIIPQKNTETLSTAIVPYNPALPPLQPLIETPDAHDNEATSTAMVPYSKKVSPVFNPRLVNPPRDAEELLNYTGGTAAYCLENIVRMNDLMSARENIKAKRIEGKNLKERLLEGKKVTAGRCFKAGTC